MAGLARPEAQQELLTEPPKSTPAPNQAYDIPFTEIQVAAAQLYGSGYKRPQIMRILFDHLAPAKRPGRRDRTREERQSLARAKLRRWERSPKFRDLVYANAVAELDLETPAILQGVAQKARRGRVDAARLALEVTGRHNPKGQEKPTEIHVQIANIPRPND
jgi:hypothetical protein